MKKLFIFLMLVATSVFAQLPVGTVRKPVYTDTNGLILNGTLSDSNAFSLFFTPTNQFHIARYMDLTNNISTSLVGVGRLASNQTWTAQNIWTGSNLMTGPLTVTNNIFATGTITSDGAVSGTKFIGLATFGAQASIIQEDLFVTNSSGASNFRVISPNSTATIQAKRADSSGSEFLITAGSSPSFSLLTNGVTMGSFALSSLNGSPTNALAGDLCFTAFGGGRFLYGEKSLMGFVYNGLTHTFLVGDVVISNNFTVVGNTTHKNGFNGVVTNQGVGFSTNFLFYNSGIVTNVTRIP